MEPTKKCPYCGEEILAAAKKCKHCHEWLEDPSDVQVSFEDTVESSSKHLTEESQQLSIRRPSPETINPVADSSQEEEIDDENGDRRKIKIPNWFGIVAMILILIALYYDLGLDISDMQGPRPKVGKQRGAALGALAAILAPIYPYIANIVLMCVNIGLIVVFNSLRKITAPFSSFFKTPYLRNVNAFSHMFVAQIFITVLVTLTILLALFEYEYPLYDWLATLMMIVICINTLAMGIKFRNNYDKQFGGVLILYGIIYVIQIIDSILSVNGIYLLGKFSQTLWMTSLMMGDATFIVLWYNFGRHIITPSLLQTNIK